MRRRASDRSQSEKIRLHCFTESAPNFKKSGRTQFLLSRKKRSRGDAAQCEAVQTDERIVGQPKRWGKEYQAFECGIMEIVLPEEEVPQKLNAPRRAAGARMPALPEET